MKKIKCIFLSIFLIFIFCSCGNSAEEDNLYHKNNTINSLITEYNEIAELPFTTDMVSEGAYDSSSTISAHGVYILMYSNSNGTFIDISEENQDNDSETICTIFKDFLKVFDSSLDDEKLNTIWNDIQTNEYTDYTPYLINNCEIAYDVSKISDEYTKFDLSLHCTNYIRN